MAEIEEQRVLGEWKVCVTESRDKGSMGSGH